MALAAGLVACDLGGRPPAPSGWFDRVCEAARLLAEDIDIEDPEDTSARNAATAATAFALIAAVPGWEPGDEVVDALATAAGGVRAASDAWARADFEARVDAIAAYLDGVQAAEPALEALAAEYGRRCQIDGRYPRLEVPA